MSEYVCPYCGADLMDQDGFDPDASTWTCTECKHLCINPDDSDFDDEDTVWVCDCCGAILNKQIGFDEDMSTWTCTECGHVNDLDPSNVYETEEDYQNSITHYFCPSCGAELNHQPSFYGNNEYTCESCGADLVKEGDEYIKCIDDEDDEDDDSNEDDGCDEEDDNDEDGQDIEGKVDSYITKLDNISKAASSAASMFRWIAISLFLVLILIILSFVFRFIG